jgi:hypothetical protein
MVKKKVNGVYVNTYKDIKDYLKNETVCIPNHYSKNEVVFTNNVLLNNLEEIWICNITEMKMYRTSKKDTKTGKYVRTHRDVKFNPTNVSNTVTDILKKYKITDIPIKIVNNPEMWYNKITIK